MVEIRPFKGLRYNKNKVDINTVVAPPYDIISPEMQSELYDGSPYNLVRLTLGRKLPHDSDENNQYTRAEHLLENWKKNEILIRDTKNMLYPYQVTYIHDQKEETLTGFFALLKIDPLYKTVKAHEHTLSKPKEDRLRLMRATESNLEPIEFLYQDDQGYIEDRLSQEIKHVPPLYDVDSWNGKNRLWALEGDETHQICEALRDHFVYIADGHHRYQTAINYYSEKENAGYRMALFVNMSNPGLTILPTHRLLFNITMNTKDILEKAKKYFTITESQASSGAEIMKTINVKKKMFALYTNTCHILTLKKEYTEYEDNNHSQRWHNLDVSILQEILLKKVMGITLSNVENHIRYTRFEEEAVELVNQGKYQIALFLNPIQIDDLKFLASRDEYLPQKSTYFIPKILSGLVMHTFH